MKICMFTMDECSQFLTSARRVARLLAQAGHEVRIIAFMGNDTTSYEETDGFSIFRIDLLCIRATRGLERWLRTALIERKRDTSSSSRPQPAAALDGSSRDVLTRDGLLATGRSSSKLNLAAVSSTLFWHLFRGAVYLTYLEYHWRSLWLARREPAHVYHAHDLNTLPLAWVCSRLAHAKLVYDSHELWLERGRLPPRSRLNRILVRRVESFLIRRTDANLAPGVSVARELTGRYSIPEPTVILNAPEYRPFEPSTVLRDETGIPQDKRMLLYVGVMNVDKGLEQMIQSLKYLPQCNLVILGWGQDQYVNRLKEFIASEGLTKQVLFHDPVPQSEVTRYAMSADVGLVLYQNLGLNYYYSSPNKLFQSMAAGLPVVASNFPDLKMYVEGYGFGATCDPKSPGEIANAVEYVLADPARYSKMRANALEAAKLFNWENEEKKILAIYEALEHGRSN